jgi:two-component system, NarL family, sensor kinase
MTSDLESERPSASQTATPPDVDLRIDECPRGLVILNAVAEALNSSVDVRQALERTLELVADFLEVPTGWVWLLDPETQQFYLAASRNLPPFLQEPVRLSGSNCLCTGLFREGRLGPRNIGALSCSRLAEAFMTGKAESALGLTCHASIPLYFQGRPVGIINLTGTEERALSSEELGLLATVAHQVAIAVERARLADEATRLARAEERSRIAREIHDTLAQDLTAIGLDIEGALKHLGEDSERSRHRLQRALTTTRQSLEEARRSVLDLRAGPPAGRSLADAINALGRSFTSDTGIPVGVDVTGAGALPLRVEAELYRVVQEALTNVRKHSQARHVGVQLRSRPDEVQLAIRDDGIGFDPAHKTDGQGLIGMRERVDLLSGRVEVKAEPGRGTTVTILVPLGPNDEA